jgi:LmbE family N-acetylglucosaminyl deacetylase
VRVVACGAHPDDVELVAGGTLLRLSGDGTHELTVVVVSDGSKGVASGADAEQIIAVRDREARQAAALVGADYLNLGFADGSLEDSPEMRQALVKALRTTEPSLVIGPPPDDYNPDHVAVSAALTAACLWAGAPGFTDGGAALKGSPALYYAAPIGGFGEHPSVFVDISSVFTEKLALLRTHVSQMALTDELFQGVDLVRLASVTDAFRGLQAGADYAEAFRPAQSWPRMRSGALLP